MCNEQHYHKRIYKTTWVSPDHFKEKVLQEQYEEEEPDLNSLWQNIKEILTSNCQEVVGLKKTQQKEWNHSINLAQDLAAEEEISNKQQSNTSDKGTGT